MTKNLSAKEAREKLMEGNRRYMNAGMNTGDISPKLRQNMVDYGQHPYAIVLCCSDSRVVPEDIFLTGLGEIFTIRVAGNVVSPFQLGSVEYAADHLGCHLCMVMGHTNCGAVDSAINAEVEGYTKFLTDEIKRAIGREKDPYRATCLNASAAAETIGLKLHAKERTGEKELLIQSCVYHTDTGEVELL